jgi:hypothetical protein
MSPLTLTCSPALADSVSLPNRSVSAPSGLPRWTPTPAACCPPTGPQSATSGTCPSSAGGPTTASKTTTAGTCGVLDATIPSETAPASAPTSFSTRLARLTSLQGAFRASLRVSLESGWEVPMNAGCGVKPCESFASFDPDSLSLRTRQRSLALSLDGPSQESSVSWPRSGMMCCGESFPLPPWVRDISANESASLLPTPIANDGKGSDYCYGRNGEKLLKLPGRVKAELLPTPTTRDWKDTPGMALERKDGTARLDQLPRVIFAAESSTPPRGGLGGMKLTPEFLCWLMGYPTDWLKPLADAPATASSRKRSSRSCEPSTKT